MATTEQLLAEGNRYVPKGYDPELYRIRHSAAHILAQAVRERFRPLGPVLLGIGPPVDFGFYYDFELPAVPTSEDLESIENRMRQIIAEDHPFQVREISRDEGERLFADEPFKLELLHGLAAGAFDENGEPLPDHDTPITVYQHSSFVDLCRGPHVARTGDLDGSAVKVLNTSGAYWRGDETRPMLQRIYGTAWRSKEELDRFLHQRAEAERRDHRRIGRERELFHFEPTAPGMPYWLPKGLKLLNTLIDFWRVEHEKRGYQEIAAPLLNDRRLWEISGHWEHYHDNMFLVPVAEHVTYGLKPMNCPNAMIVYNLKRRSYRDLPLRLSDCDTLHRNERSGTLHGLLRVQEFRQDDAHIFITEEQIEDEFLRILEIADLFYGIFGLRYSLRLGTRPKDYLGDVETWERAEAALVNILEHGAGKEYVVDEGEGAFYGPKVDILMEDAIGRSWQMGTIQLDFQLPRRFECVYDDGEGRRRTPVVIHRVVYGSLERFIGILIEHTAGAFPAWLAPVQVGILPIADRHVEHAQALARRFQTEGFRVEVDDSNERIGNKVRSAELQRLPYILVVGDREVSEGTLTVRHRDGGKPEGMAVDAFIELARRAIAEKRLD